MKLHLLSFCVIVGFSARSYGEEAAARLEYAYGKLEKSVLFRAIGNLEKKHLREDAESLLRAHNTSQRGMGRLDVGQKRSILAKTINCVRRTKVAYRVITREQAENDFRDAIDEVDLLSEAQLDGRMAKWKAELITVIQYADAGKTASKGATPPDGGPGKENPEPTDGNGKMSPSADGSGIWLFPRSSEVLLTREDLSGLDVDGLWRARNEIYARKGYIFGVARGKKLAESLGSAYTPVTSDQNAISASFNPVEKANIDLIAEVETSRKGMAGAETKADGVVEIEFIDGESNVRAEANATSAVVGQPQKGQRGVVIGRSGQWSQIRFPDGSVAWSHQKNIRAVKN